MQMMRLYRGARQSNRRRSQERDNTGPFSTVRGNTRTSARQWRRMGDSCLTLALARPIRFLLCAARRVLNGVDLRGSPSGEGERRGKKSRRENEERITRARARARPLSARREKPRALIRDEIPISEEGRNFASDFISA